MSTPAVAGKTIRVMTVDDQERFRAAARELIEATDGFEPAFEAASGEEALEGAARVNPQLALVDVRMPGMNGMDTCRRLIERDRSTVVILVTCGDCAAAAESAKASGAAALIAKQHLTRAMLRRLWDVHGPA
jgi:DNA-binding NarL/FixJ family response regulator